ncbi:MAG: hypothetical protein EOO43_14005 [Flavobacterium sp.]|nr:MAG: hypothetical protein EOO43_14005 [Flavobacterium sp.]
MQKFSSGRLFDTKYEYIQFFNPIQIVSKDGIVYMNKDFRIKLNNKYQSPVYVIQLNELIIIEGINWFGTLALKSLKQVTYIGELVFSNKSNEVIKLIFLTLGLSLQEKARYTW